MIFVRTTSRIELRSLVGRLGYFVLAGFCFVAPREGGLALGAKRGHVLDVYVRGVADLHVVAAVLARELDRQALIPGRSATISS